MAKKKDTKEVKNESEKTKKPIGLIILWIFVIAAFAASGFLIYELFLLSAIETLLRYIVIGVLLLIDLILLIRMLFICKNRRKKKKRHITFTIFTILYIIACFVFL